MSEAHIDAVLAGSRSFALALFVPLTEQVGIRPRVATDATQALSLVDGTRGLVVVEVEGEGSVRSIRELLATRGDLAVVAAVPGAMVGQEDALRAMGVELARWDGSPAAVLGAVSRRLAPAQPAAAAPATPTIATPTISAPAPAFDPAPAAPPAPFFADLDVVDELEVVDLGSLETPPADAPPPAPPPASSPPPAAAATAPAPTSPAAPAAHTAPGAAAWPSGGLTFAEAEKALARGLNGRFSSESKLRTVTEGVVNTLCALEFSVVSGDPVAVDPEPIRRSALMRLRVAAALADRPPVGSTVDQGALSEMLGEIDALLSEVNALTQGAPPEVLPSLEAVRNALVKEAIDFSEAAQELAPAAALPAAPVAAPVARRAPAARLLNVSSAPQVKDTRTRNLVVGLVVAGLVAGGYHGWRYWERMNRPLPPPPIANAPPRATGGTTAQGAKFLTSKDGKPFTDAEVETFRQREELAGRRVELIAPNTMLSVPATAPALPQAGARPAPQVPSANQPSPPGAAP